MKILIVKSGDGILPESIYLKVKSDCLSALNSIVANSKDKFIVNPTLWHNIVKTKKGELDAKHRVVNSADYLSKGIGNSLTNLGWDAGSREKIINNQRIDGYIEIDYQEQMFKIPDNAFVSFISFLQSEAPHLILDNNIRKTFNFYFNYYCASSWVDPKHLGIDSYQFFEPVKSRPIRIGLEFETGNIASSFRALHKLEGLFTEGLLDFGIFITSIDKSNTSGKIWPVSNRNGSFEELNNRNYSDNYLMPRLDIGFAPDSYKSNAKYLAHDGSLFNLEKTEEIIEVKGEKYQKFTYNNIDYWKQI